MPIDDIGHIYLSWQLARNLCCLGDTLAAELEYYATTTAKVFRSNAIIN